MMLSIMYHITPVSQEQFDTKVGLGTITPSVLPPAMLPLPRGSFLPLLDNFLPKTGIKPLDSKPSTLPLSYRVKLIVLIYIFCIQSPTLTLWFL